MSTLGINCRCAGPNFLAWVFCLVNPWSNFGEYADSSYPFDGCQRPNTGKPLSLLRELSWCLHYPNIFHTWLLAKMFLPLLPSHKNETPCSLRLPLVAARAGPGDVWALVSWPRREVDLPWAERNWRLPPDLKVSCTTCKLSHPRIGKVQFPLFRVMFHHFSSVMRDWWELGPTRPFNSHWLSQCLRLPRYSLAGKCELITDVSVANLDSQSRIPAIRLIWQNWAHLN
jgi:hypothetical protein